MTKSALQAKPGFTLVICESIIVREVNRAWVITGAAPAKENHSLFNI